MATSIIFSALNATVNIKLMGKWALCLLPSFDVATVLVNLVVPLSCSLMSSMMISLTRIVCG